MSEDSQARPGDEGVEVEEVDGGVAIEAVLAQLGLENLTESFQKEQIDFESLVSRLLVCHKCFGSIHT